jgi:hypothetical protein
MMKPANNKHTMKKQLLFIGLYVHAKNITVALAEGGGGEARLYGTIPNDLHALERVFAKLRKAHPGAELRVCYEAGPTGFVLARRLGQLKIHCTVGEHDLIHFIDLFEQVVRHTLVPACLQDRLARPFKALEKLNEAGRAGSLNAGFPQLPAPFVLGYKHTIAPVDVDSNVVHGSFSFQFAVWLYATAAGDCFHVT